MSDPSPTKPNGGVHLEIASNTNYSTGPSSGNPTKVAPPDLANGMMPGAVATAEEINYSLALHTAWLKWAELAIDARYFYSMQLFHTFTLDSTPTIVEFPGTDGDLFVNGRMEVLGLMLWSSDHASNDKHVKVYSVDLATLVETELTTLALTLATPDKVVAANREFTADDTAGALAVGTGAAPAETFLRVKVSQSAPNGQLCYVALRLGVLP